MVDDICRGRYADIVVDEMWYMEYPYTLEDDILYREARRHFGWLMTCYRGRHSDILVDDML